MDTLTSQSNGTDHLHLFLDVMKHGEFILTDKSGFVKKGGVERATSGDEIANHLLNRSGGANKEDPKRIAFANNMKQIFDRIR